MTDVSGAVPILDGVVPHPARVRLWAFYIVIVLAVLLLSAPMAPFLVIPVAWPFLAEELGIHRVHDIAVATLLWLVIAGLLAQVRRSERQIAAIQQAVVVVAVLIGLTAISRPGTLISPLLLPFGLVFVAAALHPSRAKIVRVRPRLDPFLGALALLVAGPLLVYGYQQLRLDHDALPLAAHGGHWTAMAAVAVSIVLLALLAATRPRGSRVTVWSVGAAAVLFGAASAVMPHLPSSIGPVWGSLAAVWGITFLAMAEVRQRGVSAQ